MEVLLSIAASVGLPLAINWIQEQIDTLRRKGLNSKKLSPSQVIGAISKMTAEARSKGNDVLDKLYDKVQNTQFYGTAGDAVKRYISRARTTAEKRYNRAKQAVNLVNEKSGVIDSQANTFNYENDKYKKSKEGREELADIKRDAESLDNEIKGVEKYV